MRQGTRKGLITFAAAGGVIALGGGVAHADSGAEGSAVGSPGVLSGNNVQVPVHVPVNVCGNTVNVVGLLNPAMGNNCANVSDGGGAHGGGGGHHDTGSQGGSHHDGGSHSGGQGGGSHAGGGTSHSPGVGSGNNVTAPIDIPVNVCGLGLDIVGVGNPVTGESCANTDTPPAPHTPGNPVTPTPPVTPSTPHTPETPVSHTVPPTPNKPVTQTVDQPAPVTQLAETGSEGLGIASPAAAGMLLAGTILYRRSRAAA
jgi:hypothetical protein